MSEATGRVDLRPVVSVVGIVAALGLLAVAVSLGRSPLVAALLLAASLLLVPHRSFLRWQVLLAGLVLVILFIPIKRYELPGAVPFDLEPYRIAVILIAAGWLAALLVDQRIRVVATGFEGPVAAIVATAVGSIAVNQTRILELGIEGEVVKELMFLLSYFLLIYVVVSVVRTREVVDLLVKTTALGGAILGAGTILEYRTGINVFNDFADALPVLVQSDLVVNDVRAGELRVIGSSQGPISLGALFVILLPLSVYLALRTRNAWWWVCGGVTALGAMATVSRTTIVMLIAAGAVFLVLRPRQTLRMWPVLIPAVIVIQASVPGTLGTLRAAFFPPGGLIAEQSRNPGWQGSGRVADLGPAMEEFRAQPTLGQGLATRLTDRSRRSAQILDDQWLKSLLETGLLGVGAWAWLFARYVRRLGRASKDDPSDQGWLAVALAAGITAFAVGMFLYDAFSFVQTTFVAFLLIAIGAAALSIDAERSQASG